MEIEREPATQDRRYTGTRPFVTETRMDTDTERRKLMNVCINKATTSKKLQPTIGRGSVTTEQAGEQMPMPVRCSAVKGAGRRCCRKHTGVPRSSTSLHENLHRKSYGARERRTEREASGIGPTTLRPLCARSPLLPCPPRFIGQEGTVRH